MHCAHCDSQDFTRWRGPTELEGIIFRRHRCQNCKGIFLSAQVVVDGKLARQMLATLETPSNKRPTSGFVLTPSGLATFLQAELASGAISENTASSAEAERTTSPPSS